MAIYVQLPLVEEEKPSIPAHLPLDETFPEKEANALAEKEVYNRHLYRPNTYLHKWWARRSGTLFRFILKGFVVEESRRDFYAPGGLEGRVVLDPMMGGGTTLHEAIRLGANVIGVDIDPIPVIQARATLTFRSLQAKQETFYTAWNTLRNNLISWYQTRCPICDERAEIQFVLHARRRRCACGIALFVDTLLLLDASSSSEKIWLCSNCGDVYRGEHLCTPQQPQIFPRLRTKEETRCGRCGQKYEDVVTEPFWKRYHPVALRGMCQKGHDFFKRPDTFDADLLRAAEQIVQERLDWGPDEEWHIPEGPKSRDLHRYGITSFLELFTPRQCLYLDAARKLIPALPAEDRPWFALLVSTSLEFNTLLAGYKGQSIRRPGAVRHVFAHHAYTIPYTALENNPVFPHPRSGTLLRLFRDRVERGTRWAMRPIERRFKEGKVQKIPVEGELDAGVEVTRWEELAAGQRRFLIIQADASRLNFPEGIADFVVTDPPYYDSVQYSDLSHFFRVWLRRLLPQAADWHYDPLLSAVSERGMRDAQKYAKALSGIWKNVARALKRPHGRLVFTFHHWRPEAWAALTVSLREAGFSLINCYVVLSENPVSVHIQGLKALKHDAILVLAPPGTPVSGRTWKPFSSLPFHESAAFVRACGETVGWLLQTDEVPTDQIWTYWEQLVEAS